MTTSQDHPAPGPLSGLTVIDLSRILAGPTCGQLLGDYGADVIKIERAGRGDDTRSWGPPYHPDTRPEARGESAYYLCANRNKRSIAIDISKEEGADIVRDLISKADVVVENFKVGGLKKYGLDYESLSATQPELIYCSITGFGQTGPYAKRAGYDFLAQGMGGLMSLNGDPDGEPVKVGTAIADMIAGMYAATGILAALHHRHLTGKGQHIDVALMDSQMSWLINEGLSYLTTGKQPVRRGNTHATIVPYQVFASADDHFILACGNDGQFRKLCGVLGLEHLPDDPRFATNPARVDHRLELTPMLVEKFAERTRDDILSSLEAVGVPAGPVNSLPQAFNDPQAVHRGMKIDMDHPTAVGGRVSLIGNPVKMSESPVSYRHAPPILGEHTDEILKTVCGMDEAAIQALRDRQIID